MPASRDLRAVALDDVFLAVLAELLADRTHLLAQQELALTLLHALAHVGADLVLELDVGERVLGPAGDQLEPFLDVEGLEHLDLPLEAQVGRVAARVGDLTGVVDTPEELRDLRHAAGVDDVLDHRSVLPGELPGSRCGLALVDRVGLDPHRLARAGHADADHGARQSADDESLDARAGLPEVLDLRDRADAGVAPVDLGHQQQQGIIGRGGSLGGRVRLIGLEREGDDHAGQHDPGRQWKQGKNQLIDLRCVRIGHLVVSLGARERGHTRLAGATTTCLRTLFPICNQHYVEAWMRRTLQRSHWSAAPKSAATEMTCAVMTPRPRTR